MNIDVIIKTLTEIKATPAQEDERRYNILKDAIKSATGIINWKDVVPIMNCFIHPKYRFGALYLILMHLDHLVPRPRETQARTYRMPGNVVYQTLECIADLKYRSIAMCLLNTEYIQEGIDFVTVKKIIELFEGHVLESVETIEMLSDHISLDVLKKVLGYLEAEKKTTYQEILQHCDQQRSEYHWMKSQLVKTINAIH